MRKTFILLSLLVLAFSANAFAQSKGNGKQMTAKRLFMNLPNEYVNGAEAKKQALVFPKSMNKDFLTFMVAGNGVPKRMAGDFKQPEGLGDLRVFRGKNRTIIGLRFQIGDGAEANPTVDSVKVFTYLLENKGGKWMDVTEQLIPKISLDEAHNVVTRFENTKNAKKEDVWVETQVSKDRNGLVTLARVKGSDWVAPLKFFKWEKSRFVESE